MQQIIQHNNENWPLWRKIIFRFFFLYLLFFVEPWGWLSDIPGVSFVLTFYDRFIDWCVIKSNLHFFQVFHVKHVILTRNGSGDTSYSWARQCFFLSICLAGCIIWSFVDWRRKGYRQLNYLICLLARYQLALITFLYGFDKIFVLQMTFPLQSQLATPLGDLLPMRFSWLFIGYSSPYEVFAGCMEILTGLLLLFRRTATLGVLIGTTVFINVMMLNLCYDIPVKLFSINIVLMCLYLVVNESNRIACFFVFNKPPSECTIYHYELSKKWMRITRVILKVGMVYLVISSFFQSYKFYKEANKITNVKPLKSGVYDVVKYAKNSDTLPPLITDSIRWQDMIIEKNGMGSIKAYDTLFRMRYGRAYFSISSDTLKHLVHFKKSQQDSLPILTFSYLTPDSNTILLSGKRQADSLHVELKRSNRHFQLAEKQFHWLSEQNR